MKRMMVKGLIITLGLAWSVGLLSLLVVLWMFWPEITGHDHKAAMRSRLNTLVAQDHESVEASRAKEHAVGDTAVARVAQIMQWAAEPPEPVRMAEAPPAEAPSTPPHTPSTWRLFILTSQGRQEIGSLHATPASCDAERHRLTAINAPPPTPPPYVPSPGMMPYGRFTLPYGHGPAPEGPTYVCDEGTAEPTGR